MPKVEMQEPLTVPEVPARVAASSILHEIAGERGDWSDFSLYLNLGSVGLPDVGYVAIPVTIEGVEEQLEPRHEIRFRVHARRGRESFPRFSGAIGIDATGPSNAILWLAGEYEVPGSGLGAMFDKTAAHGIAEKTLRNMLRDLADGINARVQQKELARARYRVLFSSGD
jgi:hypothetical protein